MSTTTRSARWSAAATAVAIAAATVVIAPMAAGAVGNIAATNSPDRSSAVKQAITSQRATNVILLIGDGMGDSEITIARNYAYGAAGRLPGIDALPLTGSYTTYSVYKDGATRGLPDYVPDSAATGTAWATGSKTYDNAVSVDIDGTVLPTILEIAKANGYKTGNVSTAEIQDATPAVQVAHVDQRSCYGPDSTTCGDDALIAGGLGSISEQLLNTRPDVTLGGGSASFTQTAKAGQYEGQTLFDQAAARGYTVVDTAAELGGVTKADQTTPVLGLFTPGNFPTRYLPTVATVGGANVATTCAENPARLPATLSLASLTTKAIDLLKQPRGKTGFFLQVEGASIDKRDHSADACGQIGETIDFDEAVQAALAFAKKDGNTLVIVTADHAHSSQIVDSTPPTSLSTALTTKDGTVMKISYGTAALGGSQQHTGSQLRIAAFGPWAANVVGLTDQTNTFGTMTGALGLELDTVKLSRDAKVKLSKANVGPGESVTLTVTGLNGDRQARVEGVDLPITDVIDGSATWVFTAPTDKGRYDYTVTGVQTGKSDRDTLRVR